MGAWPSGFAADTVNTTGLPSWLVLAMSGLALVGSTVTALAPAVVEKVKARSKGDDQPKPGKAPAAKAAAALDLVEIALQDLRKQRDTATRRADRLQTELDAEQDRTAQQAVRIARLEAELERRGRGLR